MQLLRLGPPLLPGFTHQALLVQLPQQSCNLSFLSCRRSSPHHASLGNGLTCLPAHLLQVSSIATKVAHSKPRLQESLKVLDVTFLPVVSCAFLQNSAPILAPEGPWPVRPIWTRHFSSVMLMAGLALCCSICNLLHPSAQHSLKHGLFSPLKSRPWYSTL